MTPNNFRPQLPNPVKGPPQNPFTTPDPALRPPEVVAKPKVPRMTPKLAKNPGRTKRSRPAMPKWQGLSNRMLGTTNAPEGGMPGKQ